MVLKVDLNIEEREFTNEKGEIVKFKVMAFDYCGCQIRVDVRKEDKALFNYLLASKK